MGSDVTSNWVRTTLGSPFVRSMMVVMSGTAVAQVVAFLLTPVVSRLYSPSDFGVYGGFDAILSVIIAGATLDYSQALMLPKSTEDAANLSALTLLSTALVSVAAAIVCVAAPATILNLMGGSRPVLLPLLILMVLAAGGNITLQSWCIRTKSFKRTSASQVVRSLVTRVSQIGLAFVPGSPMGLPAGALVGEAGSSASLAAPQVRDLFRMRRHITWTRLWELARDYRDFPLYSATQNVINALSQGLPVLLLTRYHGIAAAGSYAFAVRVVSVPMRFVLTALRQVLFQRASEAHQRGDRLFPLYLRITLGLVAVALIPVTVLAIWSPAIFTVVFGQEWLEAGRQAVYIVLWLGIVFCNLPAVLFAKIIRIQRLVFFYDLVLLATRAGALLVGGLHLTAVQTVGLFALVGAVLNFVLIIGVGVYVKRTDSNASAPAGSGSREHRSATDG